MYCHIIKDKTTGEEFLIPGCWPVTNHWGASMTDRDIIKEYCSCQRKEKDKYETHTRDEVIGMIEKLTLKFQRKLQEFEKMKEELDEIKAEVFMLNTVEIIDFEELKKQITNEVGEEEG